MKHFIFSLMAMVFVLGCSNDNNATQNVEFTTITNGNHLLFNEYDPTQINFLYLQIHTPRINL